MLEDNLFLGLGVIIGTNTGFIYARERILFEEFSPTIYTLISR